jgi:6-phosphogluconate dehydrogenase
MSEQIGVVGLAVMGENLALNLAAHLIQAQRDYFGAHTYKWIDRPGVFHTDWTTPEAE